MVMQVLDAIDSFLYYPVLLIVMGAAGLYFSVRMGFVQVRMLSEAIRVMKAKPADNSGTSPFQALMISAASCVGTGNIIGVSSAICLGGPGRCILDDDYGAARLRILLYGVHARTGL